MQSLTHLAFPSTVQTLRPESSLAALDLEPIAVKAHVAYQISREEAEEGVEELRRFYLLHLLYPQERLAPTKRMDRFWHLHINDTLHYHRDCMQVFGHVLHHNPYSGMIAGTEDEAAKSFATTKRLYQEVFGAELAGECTGGICGGETDCDCGSDCGDITQMVPRPHFADLRSKPLF